jgi:hypothetical protein
MNIDLNTIGIITSITSLILAVVFWLLATRQASNADRTLSEIKDKMMSWQNDINAATISLIQARPEVIAEKVSLEEARNNSVFMNRIADIVETLVSEADENSTGYKIAIAKELLEHQKSSIVAREQIKANILALQQGLIAEPKSKQVQAKEEISQL